MVHHHFINSRSNLAGSDYGVLANSNCSRPRTLTGTSILGTRTWLLDQFAAAVASTGQFAGSRRGFGLLWLLYWLSYIHTCICATPLLPNAAQRNLDETCHNQSSWRAWHSTAAARCLHHLLHRSELFEQPVDILHLEIAGASSDAAPRNRIISARALMPASSN